MRLIKPNNRGLYCPPGIPRINWAHPATANLLAAYTLNNGSTFVPDLTGKHKQALPSGSIIPSAGTVGGCLLFSSATTTFFNTGFQYSGGLSVIALGMRSADTTTSGYGEVQEIFGSCDSTIGTGFDFNLGNGFGPAGDKNKPRAVGQTAASPVGTTNAWLNGIKQSSSNPFDTALVNGQWYGLGATSTAVPASGLNFSIGRNSNNVSGLIGGVALVLMFNKVLPDSIMSELTLNPTAFLIYPEDDIFAEIVGTSVTAFNDPIWFGMTA